MVVVVVVVVVVGFESRATKSREDSGGSQDERKRPLKNKNTSISIF